MQNLKHNFALGKGEGVSCLRMCMRVSVEYKAQLMRESSDETLTTKRQLGRGQAQRSGVGAHTNFMYTLFYVDAHTLKHTHEQTGIKSSSNSNNKTPGLAWLATGSNMSTHTHTSTHWKSDCMHVLVCVVCRDRKKRQC